MPAASDFLAVRQLADQAFARASGAPLREGNAITLLKDAEDNYPAWLAAIYHATTSIYLEMYFFREDEQGRRFAEALIRKARHGVPVVVLCDWLGCFRRVSRRFWNELRAAGIEVLRYNRPRIDEPLGWVSRDHRKTLIIDGAIGFVTGLCIGQAWIGDPKRGLDPWRDTGVEVRGPALEDLLAAFADTYLACGGRRRDIISSASRPGAGARAGDVAMRVVATVPNTASIFRVDQLVAALARHTLWLTDAYYGGTSPYVQALRAAAGDGVDVRLLVPGESDIPIVRLFSRAGYRPLLEAGVRVFEWNGSMLHAKTAVADGRWARVGSTNLNIASWMGNRELDVVVEDPDFARQMEDMYLADLEHATEIVLDSRHRVRRPEPRAGSRALRRAGSGGRIAAGAFRVGNTMAAAITNKRVLEPVEAHMALIAGGLITALAAIAIRFPRAVAYPVGAVAAWFAIALAWRAWTLFKARPEKGRSARRSR
jgi:cardiolipin synthase A/B